MIINGQNTHEALPGAKTYVLTLDWAQRVHVFKTLGLKVPSIHDRFFSETTGELAQLIDRAFDGQVNVQVIDMNELAEDILSRATQKSVTRNGLIVSTCPEITHLRGGFTIEVNRLFDREGVALGLGARPGHHLIDEQIEQIWLKHDKLPLVLVEDGTFTGSTMIYVINKLKEKGVKVAAIVLGFAFAGAYDNLKANFDGEIIVVNKTEDYIDWMPDHDFFPFTPGNGRVIGLKWNGCSLPIYTHNGAHYSVPYLLGFCPMDKWTGIPKDKTLEISIFCLHRDLSLFEWLERLNGKPILIGDIVESYPRVSVPLSLGQKRFPSLDGRIVDFLSDTLHMY